jgi:hypothetical protein
MHGAAPTAELAVSQTRVEVTPLNDDADRVESAALGAAQRADEVTVVAGFDLYRPIGRPASQVRGQVGLEVQRLEPAAQEDAKRRTAAGRALLRELDCVEEFQCKASET